MKSSIWYAGLLSLVFAACGDNAQQTDTQDEAREATASEWTVLFDGSDLSQWRNYRADTLSDKWQIQEGTLTLADKGGGDIITVDQYEDFELELEWKISEGGNSGLFFHVVEADTLGRVYHSGPEVQILDDDRHPDGKIPMHRAGDNYDLHSVSEETVKPVGEWNQVRLVVNDGKVEHWLNGVKVVEYELGSPDWEERYQKSKFTQWPMYGRAGKGHIALQDHGDPVWFRNIRIKTL